MEVFKFVKFPLSFMAVIHSGSVVNLGVLAGPQFIEDCANGHGERNHKTGVNRRRALRPNDDEIG